MNAMEKKRLEVEILEEIQNVNFRGLIHGTRNAASVGGCRGPLCRKFHRDKGRSFRAKKRNLEFVPSPPNPELEKFLELAIKSHAKDILTARTEMALQKIG